MTDPRLTPADLAAVEAIMTPADLALAAAYPGDSGARQPVHTVYVPADRVRPGLTAEYGAAARAALDEHAPDAEALARVVGADPGSVGDVWTSLLSKLDDEPVEDLRIDLEDGYRGHSDSEEDADALAAVRAVAGAPPPFWGVRFKSFESTTRARGLRTLDLVLGAALESGPLPDGFRLTLPKVTSVEQVAAMAEVCGRLETAYGLATGRLRFEVQVETPQVILGADGTATVARLVHAAQGRCDGLHFGTYDYTAALGIAAAQQAMDHPVADHAKNVMLLAASGTGSAGLGRLDQRPAGGRPGAGAGRLGPALPAGAPVTGAWALPGVGPASGAAAHPLPGHLLVLQVGSRRRPRRGFARTSPRSRRPSSTSPRRRRRWRASSAARSGAAP